VIHKLRASFGAVLALAICLMTPVPLLAQSDAQLLDIAKTAFLEQEYDAAFEIWIPLAEGGVIDAQLALADAALDCGCVEEGTNLAFKNYRLAAKKGNVYALRQMGYIYAVKGGDRAEASVYYKAAADLGDAVSQVELGDLYRDGVGGAETFSLMPSYYLMAAAQGNASAYARMGRLYAEGGAVTVNPTKAFIAQSIAAALSFPLAKEKAAEAAQKLSAKQLVEDNVLVANCVKAKYLKCL
jgi:TPR repeat protein